MRRHIKRSIGMILAACAAMAPAHALAAQGAEAAGLLHGGQIMLYDSFQGVYTEFDGDSAAFTVVAGEEVQWKALLNTDAFGDGGMVRYTCIVLPPEGYVGGQYWAYEGQVPEEELAAIAAGGEGAAARSGEWTEGLVLLSLDAAATSPATDSPGHILVEPIDAHSTYVFRWRDGSGGYAVQRASLGVASEGGEQLVAYSRIDEKRLSLDTRAGISGEYEEGLITYRIQEGKGVSAITTGVSMPQDAAGYAIAGGRGVSAAASGGRLEVTIPYGGQDVLGVLRVDWLDPYGDTVGRDMLCIRAVQAGAEQAEDVGAVGDIQARVQAICDHLAGLEALGPDDMAAADATGDGEVTLADAIALCAGIAP